MPSLPAGVKAKAFGVTIENAGGSPVPTTPIMLHGAAA
jgi:anti-sigma-K factor RskA